MQAIIKRSILSGSLIGLGAWANVLVGGLPGAILFSFGLLCIVNLGIPLYTGKAGVVDFSSTVSYAEGIKDLGKILFGNIIGCGLIAILFYYTSPEVAHTKVCSLITNRLSLDLPVVFLKAIVCGIIVDICVWLANNKNTVIPIFLGVPLFIFLGSLHCIAEAAYILFSPEVWTWKILVYYLICVFGNYIGCSYRRIFM